MGRHHHCAGGGQEQEMPVGLAARHIFRADRAVRARLVLDDVGSVDASITIGFVNMPSPQAAPKNTEEGRSLKASALTRR